MSENKKIEAEELFINLLLNNKNLVGEWIEGGPQSFCFEKIHKFLLFAIEEVYKKNSVLTREYYYHFVKTNIKNIVEQNYQSFLFDKISILDAERDNFELYKGQIIEKYVSDNAVGYVEEFRREMEQNGSVMALKKFSKKINDLATDSVSAKATSIYEPISTYAPEFMKVLEDKRSGKIKNEVIKCGIKEIDQTMVVGFAPGTLTLFCADVGNMKSTMMLNLGINLYKSGYDVLFVPLEMPREKMYEKLLSNISEVPFEKIEHPTLLSEEEIKRIKDATQKLQDPSGANFYIMETYERIPVSIIRREIEKHVDIFRPRVVIVDYIANLTGEAGKEKERDDLAIGNMLKDLRTMGRAGAIHKDGFAVISAAQIGRDALKRIRRSGASKISFHSEDIRGSHEYSADADNIYAQMVDEAQPNERLMIFALKCRYGKKMFSNNSNKAVLETRPEISLIRSIEDEWLGHNKDNIMKRVNDSSIDINDEELAFAETENENKSSLDNENAGDNFIFNDDDDNLSVEDIEEIL